MKAKLWILSLILVPVMALDPLEGSLNEMAVYCTVDKDCSGILLGEDSQGYKVPLDKSADLSTNPGFKWRKQPSTLTEFSKVPDNAVDDYKTLAASLGFDKELTMDLDGHPVTKYYKTHTPGGDVLVRSAEEYCLTNNGQWAQ